MHTMTTMTIADLAARRVQLDEEIERLTEEKALINANLREVCDYGNNDGGDWTVQLQHNKRLDTETLEQRFPVAQYPHLYKAAIDTKALHQYLAPVELGRFQLEGDAKVLVK